MITFKQEPDTTDCISAYLSVFGQILRCSSASLIKLTAHPSHEEITFIIDVSYTYGRGGSLRRALNTL